MKLYVCWGTWTQGSHPCGVAYEALKEAGHDPEVQKVLGWRIFPDFMNVTRREVMELTGQKEVPVLVTDTGEAIRESREIVAWAKANPA